MSSINHNIKFDWTYAQENILLIRLPFILSLNNQDLSPDRKPYVTNKWRWGKIMKGIKNKDQSLKNIHCFVEGIQVGN